jgi:hypothetical protein
MTQYLICAVVFMGLGETSDSTTNEDVARFARGYRIHVYETFRLDRTEYDARRSAGDELWQWWEAAGHPADYRQVVTNWFENAVQADSAQSVPELPELPKSRILTKAQRARQMGREANHFQTSAELQGHADSSTHRPRTKGVLTSIGRAIFSPSADKMTE